LLQHREPRQQIMNMHTFVHSQYCWRLLVNTRSSATAEGPRDAQRYALRAVSRAVGVIKASNS